MDTNCGSFTITLDPRQSPNATASFFSLAQQGFYDGTIFHRIVPGFLIYGGDPSQSGAEGPGLHDRDPPPSDASYPHGTVAMAKTGGDPAGTGGSQFFIVVATDAGLPPDYAVIGQVSDGLEVIDKIGEFGARPTETPLAGRRDRQGDRRGVVTVAAVVLAAGAATRYGSPKQLVFLPYVLERLAATSVSDVVVVEGAYPIDPAEFGGVRVVTCPDWALGPGASLRCGLAALGDDVDAALVVLADGPQLDPRAVERLIEHRGDADVVVASYDGTRDHPGRAARAPPGAPIPDEGARALAGDARPLRRPRAAGRHGLSAPLAAARDDG